MIPTILSALDVEHGLDYDDLAVVEDYEPWSSEEEDASWLAADDAAKRWSDV